MVSSNSVVRKTIGACTGKYSRNWTPINGKDDDRISYGHDVENIWLLSAACKAAGIPDAILLDLYRTVFDYTLRYGFDQEHGGFYDSGRLNAPADRLDKIWWVQAEGLMSSLRMHHLTGEEVYWNCFLQTLDWIVKHQIDWADGKWHERVDVNGTPLGVKAGPWKAAYHNGRAVLECLESLACG